MTRTGVQLMLIQGQGLGDGIPRARLSIVTDQHDQTSDQAASQAHIDQATNEPIYVNLKSLVSLTHIRAFKNRPKLTKPKNDQNDSFVNIAKDDAYQEAERRLILRRDNAHREYFKNQLVEIYSHLSMRQMWDVLGISDYRQKAVAISRNSQSSKVKLLCQDMINYYDKNVHSQKFSRKA